MLLTNMKLENSGLMWELRSNLYSMINVRIELTATKQAPSIRLIARDIFRMRLCRQLDMNLCDTLNNFVNDSLKK